MAKNTISNNVDRHNRIDDLKADLMRAKRVRKYKFIAFKRGGSILLSIVLAILLGVSLMRISLGKYQIPSFTEFLNVISNVPVPEIPFLDLSFTDLSGDWGVLSFLKSFIIPLTRIIDTVLFFINGIISVITYLAYFFGWVFAPIIV